MSIVFSERLRTMFAPPRYLALPLAGIDLSTSGVKVAQLAEGMHGLTLTKYVETKLPTGAFSDGEIVDRGAVVEALIIATEEADISAANVSLSESKSSLFETTAPDAGAGFARRIVESTLSVFDQAGISVRSLEGETFASSRALLLRGDDSTVLIIDVGKTTTKMSIVTGGVPRFATTINIGGHALTLAVQKYFGVTEAEARKVKAERGIVPMPGNEEYLAAMLSTVSAIRDEISRHLDCWQGRAVPGGDHEPVARGILVGGNASVRGLPEYLEGTLQIPVAAGDVFTNLASRDRWVPSLDYTESLAYATAIGLALRDNITSYV